MVHGFLTYWAEQVRIYDENINLTGRIYNDDKCHFLENIVQDHPGFRSVKSTEDMISIIECIPVSYYQYYDLLQSNGHPYDAAMSKTKKTHIFTYMSNSTYDREPNQMVNESPYNVATPIDIYIPTSMNQLHMKMLVKDTLIFRATLDSPQIPVHNYPR